MRFAVRTPLLKHLDDFLREVGSRAVLLVGLMVISALLQGAGLMLLIPLLQIIGLGHPGAAEGISRQIGDALAWLGLPLTLPVILGAFVLLISGQALLTLWQAVLAAELTQDYTRNCQNRLFRIISFARWIVLLRRKASDFTHLLTQDVQRISFAVQQVLHLFGDLIVSTVYLVASLLISLSLSALAVASGILLMLALRPLNRRSQLSGLRLRSSMELLYSKTTEHLAGMKLSKAFARESRAVQGFEETTGRTAQEHVHFVRIRSWTQLLYQVGGALSLALFVLAAATWLTMPPAEYLVMIVIFARLLPRLSSLQQNWQQFRHAFPSFEAYRDCLIALEGETGADVAAPAVIEPFKLRQGIELRNVSFAYGKGLNPVLEKIDLKIPAGRITAVLGSSGAGKSTLADLLIGLVEPNCGQVLVDGLELDGDLSARWRRSVGYVPQESFLFHDTIRSNLLWSRPDATEDEIWEALRLGEAERFVSGLPEGLKTVVGDRGSRLSGGERQRLALTRALLIRPTLLLLDEATSQVDRESQDQILEAVSRLRGQTTVVIIAHHAPVEAIADQILFLDRGRITRLGGSALGVGH